MPLGAVGEDRDSQKIVPNRPLAIGKDGPRRDRELIPASRAFPQVPGREGVNLEAATLRTVRFPVIVAPPDLDELGMRFLVRHARNSAQGERPCGCGEKEML